MAEILDPAVRISARQESVQIGEIGADGHAVGDRVVEGIENDVHQASGGVAGCDEQALVVEPVRDAADGVRDVG